MPNLCSKGFTGNIYATFATRDLCQIMLADSARIQASDVRWLNKRLKKEGKPLREPIYSVMDADQCMRNFVNVGYDRPLPISDGVTLTFLDAGHILGSAQIILDIEDKEDGKKKRFLFSGDVGRGDNGILRDPVAAKDVDFLLMESTYGGREHEMEAKADDRIVEILDRALKRGGEDSDSGLCGRADPGLALGIAPVV
jgi:metallo-beta-lactamase family protein